jgi:hypothetical protein
MIRQIQGLDKIPVNAVSAYANFRYEEAVEAGFN